MRCVLDRRAGDEHLLFLRISERREEDIERQNIRDVVCWLCLLGGAPTARRTWAGDPKRQSRLFIYNLSFGIQTQADVLASVFTARHVGVNFEWSSSASILLRAGPQRANPAGRTSLLSSIAVGAVPG